VIVADLFAITYFGGTFLLTGSLIPHHEAEKVIVAGAESPAGEAGASATAEAAAPTFDAATYVADIAKGEKIAAKCKACHSFDAGGPNRVGPNLFGIVEAPFAHKADFSYSGALMEKKASVPAWTDAALDGLLTSPREYIPGTKMQFAGIKNPAERADLIAWLKTLK
jgi:cytochrome c